MLSTQEIHSVLAKVITSEAEALQRLSASINDVTCQVVTKIVGMEGRLIVTGMGKAGIIARKAASTFCSTGTPASFLHPAEAIHGDLGLIHQRDLVLALSNSGETEEVLALLPYLRRFGIGLVCMTGNPQSSLATQSDLVIALPVAEEALPGSSAPTNSSTAMLAMSDALAMAVMSCRGFGEEEFALFHPGGFLGRKLLLQVADLMHVDSSLPTVSPRCLVRDVIMTMSRHGLGSAFVVEDGRLLGIFTDGDLRRLFEGDRNPLDQAIENYMVRSPRCATTNQLAAAALKVMQDHQITVLPVTDQDNHLVGAIHLHDLLRAGLA